MDPVVKNQLKTPPADVQVVHVVVSGQTLHPVIHASQALLVSFVIYAVGQVVAHVVVAGCI